MHLFRVGPSALRRTAAFQNTKSKPGMAPELDLLQNSRMRYGWVALRHRPVTVFSVLLVFITLADAAWTLFLVGKGLAVEANPFMARVLEYGAPTFVAVKLVYTMPFVVVCEWLREFKPSFAMGALRFTLLAYVAIYCLGELKLHHMI
jgi:hypothetical protein